MRINTNIPSLMSYSSLAHTTGKLEKSIARLSTGLKINTAADDAAGLAISEKMNAQIRGLDQAYRNAQDGISMLQTADGALNEIHSITQRMRELSVQAANGSLTADDRSYIQLEIDQLASQINDIATQTQFNGKKLLDGSSSILWSTSSNDLGVVVTGSLLGRDRFGQVTNAEGNYKITFSTKTTGSENVQKSNILTLKHGTKQANVVLNSEQSGLTNLQALNMVEGSWRVETRERPFGGVRYYNNGTLVDPAAAGLGVTDLTVTSTPHTVAFGEYDMRVANKVPMMATFDTARVDGINISSSNLARDFDAAFSVKAGAGAGTTVSDLYNDQAAGTNGGVPTIGINNDTTANVFTHYNVHDVDMRDTLAAQLRIQESYKTASDSVIGMTLTYNSGTQDATSGTFTYAAAASKIDYTSTWESTGGDITAKVTYKVQDTDPITGDPLEDPITGTPIMVDRTDSVVIAIAAGDTIEEIADKIDAKLAASYGIMVTHDNDDGTTEFGIDNRSALFGAKGAATVVFEGSLANDLGLVAAGTFGAGDRKVDTHKDWNTTKSVDIAAGRSINQVATTLSSINGVTATVNGTVDAQLSLSKSGGNAYGGNVITFSTPADATNTANELGIAGLKINANKTGTTVMNGKTVDLGSFSDMSINAIQTALGTALNGKAAGAGTSAVSTTGDLSSFHMTNGSMYNITVSGGIASELRNGGTLQADRGANSADTAGVYNGVMRTVNVFNSRLNDIRGNLNSTLNDMLGADGISANNGATDRFTNVTGDQNATFTLNNSEKVNNPDTDPALNKVSTRYDIRLSDEGGVGALAEMWKGNKNATLGTSITSTGTAFQWTHDVAGATAGSEMATVFNAINANVANLKAEWVDDPTQAENHWGTMRITNMSNDATGETRRVYNIQANGTDRGEDFLNGGNATGTRRLINGPVDLDTGRKAAQGASTVSNHWQTEDAIRLDIAYEGNFANGTQIGLTNVTVGSTNAASYANRNSLQNDWLWEGADEDARNVARLNTHTGVLGNDFYTHFTTPDTATKSDIDKNDKWMMFTTAKTAGGSLVDVNVGDSRTGDQKLVTYAFDTNVLNAGKADHINQMLHTKTGGYENLTHNIDFGTGAEDAAHTFQYGERAGAMDAGYTKDDWKMGQEVDAWYSHAYYGDNTTYYFHSSTPDAVIEDITVNRQNSMNASIMMYIKNGELRYSMRGFDDAYANIVGEAATPKDGVVTVNADGSADIEGIHFDRLKINTGLMGEGDKFVVNVAAAAKLETANTTDTAGNYKSYANIQVTGSPFQNDASGSTAQYRFKEGAENGRTQMNMLGFYISPSNGGSTALGVGYYDGVIQLNTDAAGFHADSVIGSTDPNTAAPGAYIVHTEVNYQGKTQFSAGALVTSSHFQAMDITGSQLVVANFIEGISYSDFKFGMRDATGDYGWLNETNKQQYSDMNGSLIFEVLKAEPDMITFRVQGHFIDRDGNEYYAEDESFKLNQGRNTDKDVSDPGANNDDPHVAVHMFKDSEFGGVFFDEFKIGDVSNWMAGDRFTVALTASGFVDGKPMDKQLDPNNHDDYSKVDEIGIFSDNRGTTMPASFRFNEGILDNKTIDLKMYQLTKNLVKENSDNFYHDQVMDGTLSLSFGTMYNQDDPDRTVHSSATFDVVYGRGDDYGVAHYYSNVEDIAEFYDKNGRFILEGGNETLTIRQGDRETSINIESGMEVGELTNKLSTAVWNDVLKQYQHGLRGENDALDMSADKQYMMREEDKNKIIQFVNTVPGKSTNESVAGTILAHSVIAGEQSALEFYGSEDMMKALGFNTVQQGTNTVFTADVADAHTGQTLTTDTRVVAGTTSYDVMMDGVALKIDTDLGLRHATFDEAKGSFKLDVRDQFSEVIHLSDNTTTLLIGANEGENMFLSLGDMSVKALGIENLSVRSQASAARSVTRIDNAISFISKQRAVIGAQINRLEHTMTNLQKSSLDLTNSRSRIVEADMAKEMMNHTRINIVTQAGTAMLSQANQLGQNVLSLLR